jgi:hypothetical protein
MNLQLLAIFVLSLWLAILAAAAQPQNRSSGFDALGHFMVEADIPAGSRHAVLEVSGDLSATADWRPIIAGAIDGREARVMFRIPPRPDAKLFARIRTGPETTIPPVELAGELLYWVTYADRIEEQAKIDFMSAGFAKMREWRHLTRAESQANQIAWALANPIVESAEVTTISNNVSIRLKDGTECALLNRPRFSTDPPQPPPARTVTEWPTVASLNTGGPLGLSLPGSNAAVTAFSLEAGFPNSAPTIANWLNSRNYPASYYSSTTVQQIVQWSAARPLGALFWQAHGYSYKLEGGGEGIGIVTRETASRELSRGRYAALMKAKVLGFAGDDTQEAPFYSVKSGFFKNYVRFAPNSIVVIDACYGGHPELAAGILGAGAGSYASYDWESGNYSGTPCLKVFDRLLGMNQEPPIMLPKERPFSLQAINAWMSMFHYDVDPSPSYPNQGRPNAKLTWFHHPAKRGYILRPSAMRVLNEAAYQGEPYTKFLIDGDFGDDPGEDNREVRWGGKKMQVVRWEPWGVTIRMPASPPVGNIQVSISKDFNASSNLLPVTEWTVPFTYEVNSESSLSATLEMNVKFRGDIHGSRGMPEMPPQYLPVHFSNMADCTGTVSASGVHYIDDDKTVVWSGGSSLTSIDPNSAANDGSLRDFIFNDGTIDYTTSRIAPFDLRGGGDFTETETTVHRDGSVTITKRNAGLAFPGFGYPPPAMPINPGNATFQGGTIHFPGEKGSGKLSWPSVTPQMIPDADTVR